MKEVEKVKVEEGQEEPHRLGRRHREDEEEEEDYSIEKIRKSEKRIHKKRITKIVHTCCFFTMDKYGQTKVTYEQRNLETTIKDPKNVKNHAIKGALAFGQEMLFQ